MSTDEKPRPHPDAMKPSAADRAQIGVDFAVAMQKLITAAEAGEGTELSAGEVVGIIHGFNAAGKAMGL